jgi:large subunit ribosomal protein L13
MQLQDFVSSTLLLWWILRSHTGCAFFCASAREILQPSDLTGRPARTYNSRLSPNTHLVAVQNMTTFVAKPSTVRRDWFLIDATDKVLGRLAVEVARRLRGKHKPEFTPHVDTGDYIVVVNASKVRVTGKKATKKTYRSHSGYPGGLSETSFAKLHARFPTRAIERAVKGMLPKGPLGYAMARKLKVYPGSAHPHEAQQPKTLELNA